MRTEKQQANDDFLSEGLKGVHANRGDKGSTESGVWTDLAISLTSTAVMAVGAVLLRKFRRR